MKRTYRTGSKNIVCEVTDNVWSDEAREAAAEARRAKSGGGEIDRAKEAAIEARPDLAKDAGFHSGFAKGATEIAMKKSQAQGTPNGAYWRKAMRAHEQAAKAHESAAASSKTDEARDAAQFRADHHRREQAKAKGFVEAAEKESAIRGWQKSYRA